MSKQSIVFIIYLSACLGLLFDDALDTFLLADTWESGILSIIAVEYSLTLPPHHGYKASNLQRSREHTTNQLFPGVFFLLSRSTSSLLSFI